MIKLRAIPKKIPMIFRITRKEMREGQLLLVASSLAYTTILSIVPVLAVSLAVFKAFGGMEKLYQTIEPYILQNLAEGTSDEAIRKLHDFIAATHTGTVGASGFIGLVVTCMSMLNSIENAFNRIWRAPNTRSLFQKIASYWLFITLGPLALSIALGVVTSGDLPIATILPGAVGYFAIAVGVFFVIYKFVPNTKVHWKYALMSSVITSIFWNVARLAYNLYTTKFVSYDKIYGSLAAVPILLLWIYIAWVVVLGGAALTAALQRQLADRSESS